MKNLGIVAAIFSAALFLALFAATAYGYVSNIIRILDLFGGAIGAELVIRLVGIFVFPLGAIAGYF